MHLASTDIFLGMRGMFSRHFWGKSYHIPIDLIYSISLNHLSNEVSGFFQSFSGQPHMNALDPGVNISQGHLRPYLTIFDKVRHQDNLHPFPGIFNFSNLIIIYLF